MRPNSGRLPQFVLSFKQPRIDALEAIAVLIAALDCDAEVLSLGRESALEEAAEKLSDCSKQSMWVHNW